MKSRTGSDLNKGDEEYDVEIVDTTNVRVSSIVNVLPEDLDDTSLSEEDPTRGPDSHFSTDIDEQGLITAVTMPQVTHFDSHSFDHLMLTNVVLESNNEGDEKNDVDTTNVRVSRIMVNVQEKEMDDSDDTSSNEEDTISESESDYLELDSDYSTDMDDKYDPGLLAVTMPDITDSFLSFDLLINVALESSSTIPFRVINSEFQEPGVISYEFLTTTGQLGMLNNREHRGTFKIHKPRIRRVTNVKGKKQRVGDVRVIWFGKRC